MPLSSLLPAAIVLVTGGADCPSPAAVERELERIVAAPPGWQPSDVAEVSRDTGAVRVMLKAPGGAVLGERELPAGADCEENARLVAVVLAAWITDVHPEYLSHLPPTRAFDAEPAAPEPPPLAPSAAPATTGAPPKAAPERRSDRSGTPTARPDRASERHFVLGAGVGGQVSEAGVVPAVEPSLRYAPRASGFGAACFALVVAPEERALGAGRVTGWRWPTGVAGLARVRGDALALEAELGAMVGWLHLEGEGFVTNESANDVVAGGHAALRVDWETGSLRPFVGGRFFAWLGEATAEASQPRVNTELPAFEAVALMGVGLPL